MPVVVMSQELFHVMQENSVNVIGFTVPEGLDSMEIDKLIENVLASVTPNAKGKWVADLSGVTYLGSSLLGLMVNLRERIRQSGGTLILCGVSPMLAKIFKNCCLERLFIFARTRQDAFALVKR